MVKTAAQNSCFWDVRVQDQEEHPRTSGPALAICRKQGPLLSSGLIKHLLMS